MSTRNLPSTLAKYVAASAGLLLVGVIVANAVDASPSPTANRLMARLQAPPPPEPEAASNGYIWMLGLSAPQDASPVAWGEKHLRQLRAVAVLQQQERTSHPQDPWSVVDIESAPADLPTSPALKAAFDALAGFDGAQQPAEAPWCQPETSPCLPTFARRKGEFNEQLPEAEKLLARVSQMHAAGVFEETYLPASFDAPMPPLKGLARAQQTVFLMSALRADRGDAAGAAQLLSNDLAFQRKMLAGSRSLVLKMVVGSLLAKNLLFSHELLRQGGVQPEQIRGYLDVATPSLTQTEKSLTPALEQEALLGLPLFGNELLGRQGGSWKGAAMRFFYQPQRTVNCHLEGLEPAWALDRLSPHEWQQGMQTYRQQEAAHAHTPWYSHMVNPMGLILCKMATPDYASYIARQHDLEALRRAVALSLSADSANPASLGELARKPEFANPYTEQPFEVDAASRTLRFKPLGQPTGWVSRLASKTDGVISVAY
jgi:hypothetical protein